MAKNKNAKLEIIREINW